jgi:hypothetical protein
MNPSSIDSANRWGLSDAEAPPSGGWVLPSRLLRRREPFLWLLCLLLVIYAVLGRAGGHIGLPLD